MRKYKILIVEDELIPANYIKKILLKYGHLVIGIARSEREIASYLSKGNLPELILMDINIEGKGDGITAAKRVRSKFPSIAIIYLTAYHDEETMVRADKTNPIGYLVKPIHPETLLSTISISMSNFIKREIPLQKIFFSDTAFYDASTRTITTEDDITLLSKHEAKLLMLLVRKPKEFISYSELENSIWTKTPPSTSTLRTTLWRLKKKLPKNVVIENLYDSGYKIIF